MMLIHPKRVRFSDEETNNLKEKLNIEKKKGNSGQRELKSEHNRNRLSEKQSNLDNIANYYMTRIKGLCQCRTIPSKSTRCTAPAGFKSNNSGNREEKVAKNVSRPFSEPHKYRLRNERLRNRESQIDADPYMTGYMDGRGQAVQIVTKALEFGEFIGVLEKKGEYYRFRSDGRHAPDKLERHRCDHWPVVKKRPSHRFLQKTHHYNHNLHKSNRHLKRKTSSPCRSRTQLTLRRKKCRHSYSHTILNNSTSSISSSSINIFRLEHKRPCSASSSTSSCYLCKN